MSAATQRGTASLAPNWRGESTDSLRQLRTVLAFRMMNSLRRNNMTEVNNCRELVALVRAEINGRVKAEKLGAVVPS